ncbi:hypothetical protein PT974_12070 [Cladobotryum mycophilum]|uniref:DUF7053 domain-containing protein n=1 Tax=Cladobotryum mycophilum TaxID=491253 RepID=A0ABR0S7I9_9HYPO
MIDLNPLVTERHKISPPDHALPEERACTWYSITDKISYLPGGLVTGAVEYTCAFHDLPIGVQTHCYAPMGVDLRDKWSVGGTMPGEPPEPMELGLGAPRTGLYIREDVDLRCSIVMAGFVKKTIKKSHGTLVVALSAKAKTIVSSPPDHCRRRRRARISCPQQNYVHHLPPSHTPPAVPAADPYSYRERMQEKVPRPGQYTYPPASQQYQQQQQQQQPRPEVPTIPVQSPAYIAELQ